MPCYSPIGGYRGPGGRLSLSPKAGYYDLHINISCGQCIGCRLERSRQWAVRILHEASQHEKNSFLTLTYSEDNLPLDHSLNINHWQLFAKRVRKHLSTQTDPRSRTFRYYHCGEYGEQTGRPHYHACVFGQDFSSDRKPHGTSRGNTLYTSTQLDNLWALGHVWIGDLTFESAAYVARYVCKKVTGEKAESHYNGLKPEYASMSRKPGIGSTWIEKYFGQVYPRDEVITRGKRGTPPKFYDKRLEEKDPELMRRIKVLRAMKAAEHSQNLTPERLKVREQVTRRKSNLYKREP